MRAASPSRISLDAKSEETRQRLLAAGAEEFAERGFHKATVRDICRGAGANGAAINYHFGDKERLYLEVLRFAYQRSLERHSPDFGLSETATAEERLLAFVRSFLLRLFETGPHGCFAKMIAREMMEPTRALDVLVKDQFRPMAKRLEGIVRALIGRGADEERVRLCALSVVGQILHYSHGAPVIARLYPEQKYDAADVEQLADHVTQFSLHAMQAYRKRKKGRR